MSSASQGKSYGMTGLIGFVIVAIVCGATYFVTQLQNSVDAFYKPLPQSGQSVAVDSSTPSPVQVSTAGGNR